MTCGVDNDPHEKYPASSKGDPLSADINTKKVPHPGAVSATRTYVGICICKSIHTLIYKYMCMCVYDSTGGTSGIKWRVGLHQEGAFWAKLNAFRATLTTV